MAEIKKIMAEIKTLQRWKHAKRLPYYGTMAEMRDKKTTLHLLHIQHIYGSSCLSFLPSFLSQIVLSLPCYCDFCTWHEILQNLFPSCYCVFAYQAVLKSFVVKGFPVHHYEAFKFLEMAKQWIIMLYCVLLQSGWWVSYNDILVYRYVEMICTYDWGHWGLLSWNLQEARLVLNV